MKNSFTKLKNLIPLVGGLFLLLGLSNELYAQCFTRTTTGVQDYTIQAGTTSITVTAKGADGGGTSGLKGGEGGAVTATFTVLPGDVIRVIVGQAGTATNNSGGGGGGTAVIDCGNPADCGNGTLLLVGGGGGGQGGTSDSGKGGTTTAGGGNGGSGNPGLGATNTHSGGGGGITSNGTDGIFGVTGGVQASQTVISAGGNGGGGQGFSGGGGGLANTRSGGGGGGYSGGDCVIDDTGGPGGSNFIDVSGTSTTNTAGGDGNSTESDGSVTIICLPLPVELVVFSVAVEDEFALLTWRTASELNNEGFEIERSQDGRFWEKIGFVPGHGTTLEEQQYHFTDGHPRTGINYYRLKQMDFDGSFDYSHIQTVKVEQDGGNSITVFPNPISKGKLNVVLKDGIEANGILRIFSLTGQVLRVKNINSVSSTFSLDDLSAGMYLLEVSHDGKVWREKLFVQ